MPVKRVNIEDLYKKNKKLRKDDIEKLREWMKLQPHLPSIDEYQLILFLHSCNYSMEATKKCIDNYYTVKSMCPEIFANRSPNNPDVLKAMKTIIMTPLPKPSPDGHSLFYSRLIDTDPDNYNFTAAVKIYDFAASLQLQEVGTSPGHIIIVDVQGLTLTHAMKMNLTIVKKYLFYLQEAIPFRLVGIHYVNVVPFLDTIIGMFKPFMKKELIEKLKIHQGNNETIFKEIPKDYLPEECGGTCGPAKKIHDDYMDKVKANTAYFLEDEKLLADENKRPGKPRREGDLFGVEGNFKKLDID